jgi:hypothetical protein
MYDLGRRVRVRQALTRLLVLVLSAAVMLGVLTGLVGAAGRAQAAVLRPAPAAEPPVTVRLETAPASGPIGGLFTTEVYVDDVPAPGLGFWQVSIDYTTTALALNLTAPPPPPPTPVPAALYDVTVIGIPGGQKLGPSVKDGGASRKALTVGQYVFGLSSGPTGTIHLATIVWKGVGGHTSVLDLHGSVFSDVNNVQFAETEIDSTVIIRGGGPRTFLPLVVRGGQ